jgi:hypothetical protein
MSVILKKLFAAIFGEPSVDAAIGKFNKAVSDMKTAANHHEVKESIHREAAAVATFLASEAAAESARARQLADKFEAFLA